MKEILTTIVFLGAFFTLFIDATEVRALSLTEFVPPNDPIGEVFSTNTNDGYSLGHGIVFEMLSDKSINSAGIYHDLTDVDMFFEIAETITTSGDVTPGQTVLRSGSQTVTTSGLQWIDFSFAPLALEMGKSYQIEFTFSGSGNQNFFYNNENVTFTQDEFDMIDGTQAGNTGNFVMPAIRVMVPEPSAFILTTLGLFGMGRCRRKRA